MAELIIEIPDKLKREIEESKVDVSLLIKRPIKQPGGEKEMIDWSVKLQKPRYVAD